MADFSHLSEKNQAQMVDISAKKESQRVATVGNEVTVSRSCADKLTLDMLREISSAARVAGVFAAKKTCETIPMCHPIAITGCDIDISFDQSQRKFFITVDAKTRSNTGVEMEAFCASSVAALTIYDMIKAVDPAAVIGPMLLLKKTGGKSGEWDRHATIS
jgi:cyclic pyranopterin phosphate synthase